MSIADEMRKAIIEHRQETGSFPDAASLSIEGYIELRKWAYENSGISGPEPSHFMGVEVRISREQREGVVAHGQ